MVKRIEQLISILKILFPNPRIELEFSTPWELFVAVVLSAQSTDKKVNEVTKQLFKKYKTIKDYKNADQAEFERDIKSIGLYRNKAKNITASAKIIDENYKGKIPDSMEELLKLSGVGRKTANILLSNIYKKAVGIAVDTHITRLSKLFGLTTNKNPDKIESDLMKIIPKKEWLEFNHRMVLYGRRYCPAHCKHTDCPLREFICSV